MFTVKNVVAVGTFGCRFDLNTVMVTLKGTEYNPQKFSGLLIRSESHHCQLYCNGKFTVNGGTSTNRALELAQLYCAKLREIGYTTATVREFRVVNMVACTDFKNGINLPKIKARHPAAHFEPELFPGLSIRFSEATAVLFHTGKCNILGAKDEYEVFGTLLDLYVLLGFFPP
jgi:TATA-box binding protein (TBP) (component of TFIID and TFIIIB)